MRKIRTHRLLCWLALCATARALQQDPNPSQREQDVYRIYSLLMTNPQTSHGPDDNPRYLIAATTRSETPQGPCVRPPKDRAVEFQEVLTDHEARKTTPRTLKRQLSIPKPYDLLTAEEVSALQNERDWPKPDRKPPSARFAGVTDLFTLSDVYFSRNGRLALTALSSWCGGLCGQHEWKVLEKLPSGEWKEQPWITCFTIAGEPHRFRSVGGAEVTTRAHLWAHLAWNFRRPRGAVTEWPPRINEPECGPTGLGSATRKLLEKDRCI